MDTADQISQTGSDGCLKSLWVVVLQAFLQFLHEDGEDFAFSCHSPNSGYIYIQILFQRKSDQIVFALHTLDVAHLYTPMQLM